MGNNGGDGLAIARMLHQQGYGVKTFVLKYAETFSADCYTNLQRLQQEGAEMVNLLQPGTFITDIPADIIIIDALLGTGLNRPAEGWLADFITGINQLPNRKIAIDTPSGMPADTIPAEDAAWIHAGDTLSFQFYKRSLLHPEAGRYAGNIHLLDIELDPAFIAATHTHYHTAERETVHGLYKKRSPYTHKGTYGTAMLIGGSFGMMGAIMLATKAALRAGAGKVKALVPGCGYMAMQTALPEAMCQVSGVDMIEKIKAWEQATAIGIGPGIGTAPETMEAFGSFIESCTLPLVLDADALNILAQHPDMLNKIPAGSIMTPHPKEFERMFGKAPDSMMQLELARTQAMRYNIYIVLKGHHTVTITPEGDCWYNTTGNAGMATGGSGDVLCGIITGLLAQQYEPYAACVLGVYLHGLAGDLAAAATGQEALIAGDIIDWLGRAFLAVGA
jgi:NAD(P)H-hydrate epimerase